MIERLAASSGIAASAIDVDAPLATLGLPSLALVQLGVEFAARVGVSGGDLWLWEHPTIRRAVDAALGSGRASHAQTTGGPPRGRTALIGLACRFPGAGNASQFWRQLEDGRQSVCRVPEARLALAPELAMLSDETAWAGWMDDVDKFDPAFFGISPAEARQMDPQQRLALELSWEALEDAGVVPQHIAGGRVGVFWGAWRADYASLLSKQDAIGGHAATGGDLSVLAGRVSYALGLAGPSLTVATACSSSLVAVHLARRSLLLGEVDLAIVGASNVLLDPASSRAMQQLGALSRRGRCSPFEESGDGYVRAEGAGVVILQREADALRAGARAYCSLLGSAVNSDGASNGLTAPNPGAQRAMLEEACRDAGIEPESVDYVEAHGTGTPLGDPIEAAALGAVLGRGREADARLLIGSVKANIGHAEAAAGMAGLIKVALSVHHGRVPGTPGCVMPSSRIDFAGLGLEVSTDVRSFRRAARRAGVSSFGFSGTNAHVMLEAAGEPAAAERQPPASEPERHSRPGSPPRVALVFNGQGAHWPGMGRWLAWSSPTFRSALLECDALFREQAKCSIADELCAPTSNEAVSVQWALHFSLQYALGVWCAEQGLVPAIVIGHSIGEVAAAVFSEALTLRQAVAVIHQLSRAAEQVSPDRALVAVAAPPAALQAALAARPSLEIAGLNGPEQTLLVGPLHDLRSLLDELGPGRAHHVVSGAAVHSARFEAGPLDLSGLDAKAPRIPCMSSAAGGRVERLAVEHWATLLSKPIRFSDALEGALAEGVDLFVEIGPHGSLQRAISSCVPSESVTVLSVITRGKEAASVSEFTAKLRELGLRRAPASATPRLLSLSARDDAALRRACAGLHTWLGASPAIALDDVCFTSNLRRTQHARRVAIVAASSSEAADALAKRAEGLGKRDPGTAAFYFSGDGGQWSGMGLRLAELDRPFAETLTRCDAVTREEFDWPLIERLRSPDEQETTEARQPLVVAIQLALAESMFAKGVEPAVVVGNSLGEIAAAFAAGALDLRSAMRLSVLRSRSLARASGSGGMLFVQLPPHECVALLGSDGRLRIAIEYLRSCVVAGQEPGLTELLERAKSAGVFCRRVNVDIPGHTQILEPAADELVRAAVGMSFGQLRRPMWSTSLDRYLAPDEIDLQYFARSICLRVGARQAMTALLARGVRAILELGPHPVMQRSLEEIVEAEGASATVLPCMKRDEHPLQPMYEALAGVYEHGANVDLAAVTRSGRSVSLPAYPWNHRSHWLEPASSADRAAVGAAPAKRAELSYQVRWEATRRNGQPQRPRQRYVLFADQTGLAAAAAERIQARGQDAFLVHRGARFARRSERVFEVGSDAADYAALARQLEAEEPLDVVTCWPLALHAAAADPTSEIAALCEHLCRIRVAFEGRARAAIVTRGAVSAGDTLPAPEAAAVWAFAASLELEWHAPFARIDLEASGSQADPDHLLEAASSLGDGEEWALRAGTWYRARLSRTVEDAAALPVRADGAYWIVGGLGHVGLTFAQWLESMGARQLILSSRSDRSQAPEVRERLQRLASAGAQVECVLVDVTDAPRVEELRRAHGSRLRGVVHAAGTISHTPAERLTRSEIERVLRTKIDGCRALSAACAPGELDFLLFFSSAAATWGASGLAHYAAANRYLDALAMRRGNEVLSVGWGRWSGGGMVTAAQEALFDRIGLQPLTAESAFGALASAHARRLSHVVIADADWTRLRGALQGRGNSQLCAGLGAGSGPSAPERARARFEEWRALSRSERGRVIEDFVEARVRALLELDVDQVLAREAGLFDLGIDSVLSVRLAAGLSAELGVRLTSTAVLEHASVRKLGAHLWRVLSSGTADVPAQRNESDSVQTELERELLDCSNV